ncbi:hypothetical protein NV379_14820 [Paenibacillus sp. N1-5-1-14]|uniref:hypothetical protein n=1 Tax=Paenibacillus radicibacter TaxID=2972488 RepID=UPI0021591AF9|nr:hypothetical protein [Paenibacillus radicibacter]MCR8643926.1 hypothetical protein [Paenibacillus radicibacter]
MAGGKSKRLGNNANNNSNSDNGCSPKKKKGILLDSLTPQQLAVVAALLTNALEVESILLDRNQSIEILLTGSLRPKKNQPAMMDPGELFALLIDAQKNR